MPLTSKIIEDIVDKKIEKHLEPVQKSLDRALNLLDWLVGQYKKQDEEHTVVSYQVSNHSDRIENLEIKTFGSSQV